VVNKQWLDKLGLEVPKTLADLKEVLIAFRDKDPNGNGVADEIPMDMYASDFSSHYSILKHLGSWGMPSFNNQIFINDDHQIVMSYTTEAYKELVKYAADLWSENLINKESFTQDYTMFQANAQNPEIPLVGVTNGYSIANRVGTQWADQYVVCGPFELGDGTAPYYLTTNNVQTNKAEITTKCQNIDAAIRVLDALYDPEISIQMMLGSIGDTLVKESDGTYSMVEPNDGSDVDRWKWINAPADNGAYYISREMQDKIKLLPGYYDRLEQSDFYKPYFRNPDVALYPSYAKMSADDANELALLNADIINYVSNRFATWITNGGVEAEWDSYLKQLNENMLPTRLTDAATWCAARRSRSPWSSREAMRSSPS
jgi:putative aldouronate transport system substrate-binding protein